MIKLAEILRFMGFPPSPEDYHLEIEQPNAVELANHSQFSYISNMKNYNPKTQAAFLICAKEIPDIPQSQIVRVDNPRLWFIRICNAFFPPGPPKITYHNYKYVDPFARIGGEGFGFEFGENGLLEAFPHYAGVTIGNDVEIKAFAAVDRGVFQDTIIGDGTKIDNLVHVAHNVKIGKNCLLVAGTIIGGGCEIGDNAYLMINSLIKPHVKIGRNTRIGMGAVVLNDVPDNETIIGNPGRELARKEILIV